MKKLVYIFASVLSVLFMCASLSAAIVVNDTQTWNTHQDAVPDSGLRSDRVDLDDPLWSDNTLRIGPGGDLTITIRAQMDARDRSNTLILDGGILTTQDTFKASNNAGDMQATLLINSGEWFALDIESHGSARNSTMTIKDGVVWLETQAAHAGSRGKVSEWLNNGFLQAADGYTLVFQDFAGNAVDPAVWSGVNDSMRISAIPEPTTVSLLAGLACLGFVLLRRRRR